MPAARKHIVDAGLNELLDGDRTELGIIVQGGSTTISSALQALGLADAYRARASRS